MNEVVENAPFQEDVVEVKKEETSESQIDIEKKTIKNNILLGNPFMYVAEYKAYEIDSIEDYFVKYKRETKSFGDIVRSVDFRKGKKKRLTKKIFEHWKNDYLITMTKSLNDDIRRLGARPEIKRVHGALTFFLLLITLVYAGLIFITFQTFFELPGFFATIVDIIKSSLNFDNYLFVGVSLLLGVLIILAYFLKFKYTNAVNNLRRSYDRNDRVLEASKNRIMTDFTRKFKEVYKYYMRNIKKNDFFIPFGMEGVGAGERITAFSSMVEKTAALKEKYDKSKIFYTLFKFPVFLLVVCSILFIIGYITYIYIN